MRNKKSGEKYPRKDNLEKKVDCLMAAVIGCIISIFNIVIYIKTQL